MSEFADFMVEAAARNAVYSAERIAFREANDHPGPLPGYGGRGTSVVSQHKLAVSNPRHFHAPIPLGGLNSGVRPYETAGYIALAPSPEAVDEDPLG